MAEEPQRIFVKPPDFASVHADGVIVRLEHNDLSRLIFYQKSIETTEDGRALDRSTEYINLKFEVRFPREALEEVVENCTEIFKLGKDAWKMQGRAGRDQGAKDSWWGFTKKSESVLFGSEDFLTSEKELQQLSDEFDNLRERAKKKRGGEPESEHSKV